jgi:hypothetical protein
MRTQCTTTPRGDRRCRVPIRRPPAARSVAAASLVAAALLLVACSGSARSGRAGGSAAPSGSGESSTPAGPAGPPVFPLTGLRSPSRALAARPALSIKIDNVRGAFPQAGLNEADLVADVLVEGGLTRLLATFQSRGAELVGPIRSARPVDAELLRELNGGVFAYSGAAPGEIAPVKRRSTALLLSNDAEPRWFWRDARRPSPHTVFSSTRRLYSAVGAHAARLVAPPQLFNYTSAVETGRAVTSIALHFSPTASAGWRWTGRYYVRTQDGRPDTLVGGAPVSTTNVVVMSVGSHGTGIRDAAGNEDPYVVVTGSGACWVLRDGRLLPGRWVRPTYQAPVRLLDTAGNRIPLTPGRTWMELLPQPAVPIFR